jgi:hypothetical protein
LHPLAAILERPLHDHIFRCTKSNWNIGISIGLYYFAVVINSAS